MRLFVDCDDTLVLWNYVGQKDGLYYTDGYQLNQPLIEAIEHFLEDARDSWLVVWSGGGLDYAKRWARLCFPDRQHSVESKNIHYPQADDLCIDDQQIKVAGGLVTPEAFVARNIAASREREA